MIDVNKADNVTKFVTALENEMFIFQNARNTVGNDFFAFRINAAFAELRNIGNQYRLLSRPLYAKKYQDILNELPNMAKLSDESKIVAQAEKIGKMIKEFTKYAINNQD